MRTVTFCNELNDNKIGYPSYVPRATHRFTFDWCKSSPEVALVLNSKMGRDMFRTRKPFLGRKKKVGKVRVMKQDATDMTDTTRPKLVMSQANQLRNLALNGFLRVQEN